MPKVLIGCPSYSGHLNINLIKYLDNFSVPEGWSIWKSYVTRTPIHMARNLLLKKMVEDDYDKLIMIDDDEYPMDPDCFMNLLLDDKDIVSWIVRLRTKKENLCILHRERYLKWEKWWYEWMRKYVNYKTIPQKWLFKIDNAWCWLICISKKVAEKALKRYWQEPFESKSTIYVKMINWDFEEFWHNQEDVFIWENWRLLLCRRTLSEDYLFFERCISMWFQLRADSEAKVAHLWNPEIILP